MSGGGPPHHPHNRHVPPAANSAWSHLQVPSYYPRQPQLAHMQAEHSLLHQASWHTPTSADAMKMMPHAQMLNEMFKNEALFPRDCVDLSLTRNGNQNGELSSTPAAISLSVRDTSKINSLPPSMLDIQAVGLTKIPSSNLKSAISPGSMRATSISPGLMAASPVLLSSVPAMKSLSPGRKSSSPGLKASSPGLNLGNSVILPSAATATISSLDLGKSLKRSNIRVDSILERLNPTPEKTFPHQDIKQDYPSTAVLPTEKSQIEKLSSQSQSVIVSAASNYDENSNSSGTTNVPTPKEEDSASMHSNEDSLDSTKSRRKRKPSKTIRVNKEDDIKTEKDQIFADSTAVDFQPVNHKEEPVDFIPHPSDPAAIATILEGTATKLLESTVDEQDGVVPAKTRRKASSESETIDNIAAMVQEGLKEKAKWPAAVEGESEMKAEETFVKLILLEMDSEEKEAETPLLSNDAEIKLEMKSEQSSIEEVMASELDAKTEKQESSADVMSVPVDTIDGSDCKGNDPPLDPSDPPELEKIPPAVVPTKPVTVSVIKTKEILEETLSSDNDVHPDAVESVPVPTILPLVAPLVTPAQKKASITHFVEVENKLEEMFAGIVEEAPATNVALEPLKNDSTLGLTDDSFIKLDDSATLTKQEVVTAQGAEPSEVPPASPKVEVKKAELDDKKPTVKKARRSRLPSKRDSDQDGEVPPKKKRLTKTKSLGSPSKRSSLSPAGVALKSPKKNPVPVAANKTPTKLASSDVLKDLCSYDSGSNASSSKSKGPFVQIRGPRDSPVSVSVVNTLLTGDEDGEKKAIKNKKFHDDSEYRHKVRSKGLHCSTLSTKYDAERKDATWICAFCKRGPHASELSGPSVISEVPPSGDLFGPYFITTQCPEFEKRLDDPYDRQFKSRKISKVLDAAASTSTTTTKSGKKTKRKSESSVDPTDIYLGITDTGNNTYEVWLHEDCMVWSSGIYLIGPKIAGLEEAVWTCSNLPCSGCGLRGANVACVKRGCLGSSHLCCARKAHWRLDEANFKAYCPEHSR